MGVRGVLTCYLCLSAAAATDLECAGESRVADESLTALIQREAVVSRHESGRSPSALEPAQNRSSGALEPAQNRSSGALEPAKKQMPIPFQMPTVGQMQEFAKVTIEMIRADPELAKELQGSEVLSTMLREVEGDYLAGLKYANDTTVQAFTQKALPKIQLASGAPQGPLPWIFAVISSDPDLSKMVKESKVLSNMLKELAEDPKAALNYVNDPIAQEFGKKALAAKFHSGLQAAVVEMINEDPELSKEVKESPFLSKFLVDLSSDPMAVFNYRDDPAVQAFGKKVLAKFPRPTMGDEQAAPHSAASSPPCLAMLVVAAVALGAGFL